MRQHSADPTPAARPVIEPGAAHRAIGRAADTATPSRDAATAPGSPAIALVQEHYGNHRVQAALMASEPGLGEVIAHSVLLDAAGIGSAHGGLTSNAAMLGAWRHGRGPDVDLANGAVRQLAERGGWPLPLLVRARMESAFGHGFEHVRVHVDSQAAQAADALSARAFSLGAHLFFGDGQWAPGTPSGDRLLAHELTHVQQHDLGELSGARGVSDPSDRHEVEAYANEDHILSRLGTGPAHDSVESSDEGLVPSDASVPTTGAVMRYSEAIEAKLREIRELAAAAVPELRDELDDIVVLDQTVRQYLSSYFGRVRRTIAGSGAFDFLLDQSREILADAYHDAAHRTLEHDIRRGLGGDTMTECLRWITATGVAPPPDDAEGDAPAEDREGAGERSGDRGGARGERSGRDAESEGSRAESEEGEDRVAEGAARDPEVVDADAREVTHHQLTGTWSSSDDHDATMQLSQAGTYFTGRYQVRERDPEVVGSIRDHEMGELQVNRGNLRGEVTRDTLEVTEFRYDGTPVEGRHTEAFGGTITMRSDTDLTLTQSGDTWRFRRSTSGAYSPALSDDQVEALDDEAREDVDNPLSDSQRERVGQAFRRIAAACREYASGFFGAVNPITSRDHARTIETECAALRHEFPEVQHGIVRQDLRQLLFRSWANGDETTSCLEMTRVIAYEYEELSAVTRDFLQLERPSAGDTDAGEAPFYYRMRFVVFGVDAEIAVEAGLHAGRVTFEEGRLPNGAEEPGPSNWTTAHQHTFSMIRGTLGIGASAGLNFGEYTAWKYATPTDNHWRMSDISGRFYTGGSAAGVRVGPGAAEGEASVLYVVGNAGYRPLEFVDFGLNADVLFGAGAGVGVQVQGGYMISDEALTHTEEDEESREHGEGPWRRGTVLASGSQDFVGFETDVAALTEEGRRRLRQFCAENLALLRNPETRVEVHGYASRRGTDEHNLDLSQRRADNTFHAMSAMLGYTETSWRAVGHGEEDARAAGLPEGDDSDTWRRVDVMINGELAVRIRASRDPSHYADGEPREPYQRKASGSAPGGAAPEPGPGAPMAAPVRGEMEQAFGADFSDVRVQMSSLADRLGARAFTQGTDVVFSPGTYDPGSRAGRELLGHELTHVVQQREGRVADVQASGSPVNADRGLEGEADAMGARVAQGTADGFGSQAQGAAHGTVVQRDVSNAPVQQTVPITHEVVVDIVAFEGTEQKSARDIAAADAIYRRYGITIVPGRRHPVVTAEQYARYTTRILQPGRTAPEWVPTTNLEDPNTQDSAPQYDDQNRVTREGTLDPATREMLGDFPRTPGHVMAYWVRDLPGGTTGFHIAADEWRNLADGLDALVVDIHAGDDVFAHELLHVLTGEGHTDLDRIDNDADGAVDEEREVGPENLAYPTGSPPGGGQRGGELTEGQIGRILESEYVQEYRQVQDPWAP